MASPLFTHCPCFPQCFAWCVAVLLLPAAAFVHLSIDLNRNILPLRSSPPCWLSPRPSKPDVTMLALQQPPWPPAPLTPVRHGWSV